MLVLGRKRWILDQYLYHSEVHLENCWKLSMVEDPALRAVSIVKDLTARHRAGEKEMYKEAASKNISKTEENIENNMAFKIVGPRWRY